MDSDEQLLLVHVVICVLGRLNQSRDVVVANQVVEHKMVENGNNAVLGKRRSRYISRIMLALGLSMGSGLVQAQAVDNQTLLQELLRLRVELAKQYKEVGGLNPKP